MLSKPLMTASSVFLLALGLVLNFAPMEIASRAGFAGMPLAGLTLSLLAGALMGLGVVNWMSKNSGIGGIYGRPLAMGNLLHFVVGAFGLGRAAATGAVPDATWALFAVYLIFALGFGWLVFAGEPGTTRAPKSC